MVHGNLQERNSKALQLLPAPSNNAERGDGEGGDTLRAWAEGIAVREKNMVLPAA